MTFKELRKQKNTLQHKLNFAEQQNTIKTEEIKRLIIVLGNEQKLNSILEYKVELVFKAKKRA